MIFGATINELRLPSSICVTNQPLIPYDAAAALAATARRVNARLVRAFMCQESVASLPQRARLLCKEEGRGISFCVGAGAPCNT